MNDFIKTCMFFTVFCVVILFSCPASAHEDKAVANDDGEFRFSAGYDTKVFAHAEKKDIRSVVEQLLIELSETKGARLITNTYKNTNSIIKDLQSNKLDFVVTTPINYLRIAEEAEIEVAFGALSRGKKTRKYLLIVRSDSGFTGVKDLRRKKIAFRLIDDTCFLFLNVLLLRNNLQEAGKYFRSIIKKRKHSQAILSVYFRKADVCITTDSAFSTMIELNPQVGKQLKIIASSPDIIMFVFLFRKNYEEKYKNIIRNTARKVKDTVNGRQLLLLFMLDEIVSLKDSELDTLRALLNEYEELKNNH